MSENVEKYKTAIDITVEHSKDKTNRDLAIFEMEQAKQLSILKAQIAQGYQTLIRDFSKIFKDGGCNSEEIEELEQYFVDSLYKDGFLQSAIRID